MRPGFGRVHRAAGMALRMPQATAAITLAQLEIVHEQVAHRDRMARLLIRPAGPDPGRRPLVRCRSAWRCGRPGWWGSASSRGPSAAAPTSSGRSAPPAGIPGASTARYYLLPAACTFLQEWASAGRYPYSHAPGLPGLSATAGTPAPRRRPSWTPSSAGPPSARSTSRSTASWRRRSCARWRTPTAPDGAARSGRAPGRAQRRCAPQTGSPGTPSRRAPAQRKRERRWRPRRGWPCGSPGGTGRPPAWTGPAGWRRPTTSTPGDRASSPCTCGTWATPAGRRCRTAYFVDMGTREAQAESVRIAERYIRPAIDASRAAGVPMFHVEPAGHRPQVQVGAAPAAGGGPPATPAGRPPAPGGQSGLEPGARGAQPRPGLRAVGRLAGDAHPGLLRGGAGRPGDPHRAASSTASCAGGGSRTSSTPASPPTCASWTRRRRRERCWASATASSSSARRPWPWSTRRRSPPA